MGIPDLERYFAVNSVANPHNLPAKSKLKRKWLRCVSSFEEVSAFSGVATPVLFVGNGGTVCGWDEDSLKHTLSCAGMVSDVRLFFNKPYALVEFDTVTSSLKAIELLQGVKPSPTAQAPFYLAFMKPVEAHALAETEPILPPGLFLIEDFVSPEEELELRMLVGERNAGHCPEMSLKKRTVFHYGYNFVYGANAADLDTPADPIPPLLQKLIDRMMESSAGTEHRPDQITVNVYEPGQGIPSHVDTHSAFEDSIISLGICASIVIDFNHPSTSESIPVLHQPRTLLVMRQESRYIYTHAIAARKFDVSPTSGELRSRQTRISFTFRAVRRKKCTCGFSQYCDWNRGVDLNPKDLSTSHSRPLSAAALEKSNVHEIYEEIASHFDQTRHTPWPGVASFLDSLPKGAAVLDVGCGNGKYLGRDGLLQVGCDRSHNLCIIARRRSDALVQADCLSLPFDSDRFDAVISIAVIHHLSTEARRREAVKEMLRVTRQGGKVLIYVWAFEQRLKNKSSAYLKQCAKGDADDASDSIATESAEASTEPCLMDPPAVNSDVTDMSANSDVSDFMNSLPVHKPRTEFKAQDVLVPWTDKRRTLNRYYHVFQQGELEKLCAGLAEVDQYFYEQGNWCIVLRKF